MKSELTRKNFLCALRIIKATNRMISRDEENASAIYARGKKMLEAIPGAKGNHALATVKNPAAYGMVMG